MTRLMYRSPVNGETVELFPLFGDYGIETGCDIRTEDFLLPRRGLLTGFGIWFASAVICWVVL